MLAEQPNLPRLGVFQTRRSAQMPAAAERFEARASQFAVAAQRRVALSGPMMNLAAAKGLDRQQLLRNSCSEKPGRQAQLGRAASRLNGTLIDRRHRARPHSVFVRHSCHRWR